MRQQARPLEVASDPALAVQRPAERKARAATAQRQDSRRINDGGHSHTPEAASATAPQQQHFRMKIQRTSALVSATVGSTSTGA